MPNSPELQARRPGTNPQNIAVPFAPEDIQLITDAAKMSGFNRAAWCRETLVSAAREYIARNENVE